jgi:uncharacterized protein
MPSRLTHIALNADDVEATRRFYEGVMGWRFSAWGQPGFFRADASQAGVTVAVQARRELVPGVPSSIEPTFAVNDLRETAAAIAGHGGQLVTDPAPIPGVGTLLFFADPSGNVAGAMRYEAGSP